jgi:hypothetical protein
MIRFSGTIAAGIAILTALCMASFTALGQQSAPRSSSGMISNLPWATYAGGLALDRVLGVKTDSAGFVYVCGWTNSANMPVTPGAWQGTYADGTDAFIAKYSPAGLLLWCTFFGGSNRDEAAAIAVDSLGRVYIVGSTSSTNLPVTGGAQQPVFGGGTFDTFVACFDGNGALLWCTYLGGSALEYGLGIATGPNGRTAVAGYTKSTNFPTTPGAYQGSHGGEDDGFLAVFSSSGAMQWCTLLGGTSWDDARVVTIDRGGDIAIAGDTQGDFPVTPGAQQPALGGNADGFLASFTSQGALRWATYVGGSSQEYCFALATDSLRRVYVCGSTRSTNFPVTPGAAQGALSGGANDAFIARYSSQGALQWATYYGGTSDDRAYGIAVDRHGQVHVGGSATSDNFPVTPGAAQQQRLGQADAFLLRMSSDGAVTGATLLGGNQYDEAYAIAADSAGYSILGGGTKSDSSLATSLASQRIFGGGNGDGFIARVHPQGYWPVELLSFSAVPIPDGVQIRWSTASETANAGFDVQRSTDRSIWRSIAYVAGGGSTQDRRDYACLDAEAAPSAGSHTLFYRLRQIDFDGTISNSPVVEVRMANASVATPAALLQAPYPNPAAADFVIPLMVAREACVRIAVYDVLGRRVAYIARDTDFAPGLHTVRVNTSEWDDGVYLIELHAKAHRNTRLITVRR